MVCVTLSDNRAHRIDIEIQRPKQRQTRVANQAIEGVNSKDPGDEKGPVERVVWARAEHRSNPAITDPPESGQANGQPITDEDADLAA